LIEVVERDDRVRRSAGSITDTSGKFLPWVHAWGTLGAIGDTLLWLDFMNAEVTAFAASNGAAYRAIQRVRLPKYMRVSQPTEEIVQLPWIQFGGDMVQLSALPQVGAAAFGQNGRIYAVRTYAAVWQAGEKSIFRRPGRWFARDDALEVYDRMGRLMGTYSLPAGGVDWIRVDDHGRIFMHSGRTIVIVRDPYFQETADSPLCTQITPTMTIPTRDRAPSPLRLGPSHAAISLHN